MQYISPTTDETNTGMLRFGLKVSHIEPTIGQILEFFRSNFTTFWSDKLNVLKSDLKKSRICPIWSQI